MLRATVERETPSSALGRFPFQSTHPARGATLKSPSLSFCSIISIHAPRKGCDGIRICLFRNITISIHAPRKGCDILHALGRKTLRKFQSTHPERGATYRSIKVEHYLRFQSTHPARGATHKPQMLSTIFSISIHAPRKGCDTSNVASMPLCTIFQSTHPARGATLLQYFFNLHSRISIHAPRKGCDIREYTR